MAAFCGITKSLELHLRGQAFQDGFSLEGPSWTDNIEIHEDARYRWDSLRSTPLAALSPSAVDFQSQATAASACPGVCCRLPQQCTLVAPTSLLHLVTLFSGSRQSSAPYADITCYSARLIQALCRTPAMDELEGDCLVGSQLKS